MSNVGDFKFGIGIERQVCTNQKLQSKNYKKSGILLNSTY